MAVGKTKNAVVAKASSMNASVAFVLKMANFTNQVLNVHETRPNRGLIKDHAIDVFPCTQERMSGVKKWGAVGIKSNTEPKLYANK